VGEVVGGTILKRGGTRIFILQFRSFLGSARSAFS
jgi:hypothetical protein